MARKVFYSFHYKPDSHRASQVRNIGKLEGNSELSANAWESLKRTGKEAVHRWIREEMVRKSCVVVLIGAETAERPYVKYEIEHAWKQKKGVLGIDIHKILDLNRKPTSRGPSPFARVSPDLDGVAPRKNPAGATSKAVYATISANIGEWVEEAVEIRGRYE